MDRSFFRDLIRCLVVISIFYSCGQSVWFISELSNNETKRSTRYYENRYQYNRSYQDQYVEEEVEEVVEDTIVSDAEWR